MGVTKNAFFSQHANTEGEQRLCPCYTKTHAANCRPLELFAPVQHDAVDFWLAPIDSELDVAYFRPSAPFTQYQRPSVLGGSSSDKDNNITAIVKTLMVGYQGEVNASSEEGFRTERYSQNGSPLVPKYNPLQMQSTRPLQRRSCKND
jgi:hypothetical protein